MTHSRGLQSTDKHVGNYAFIDGQNLYLGIKSLGREMDYRRFRTHLAETYGVARAFIFLGYLEKYESLYQGFRERDYEIIFKEVSHDHNGVPKGNVDVLLTLHTILLAEEYAKAVLVTSDGDFAPLVEHLVNRKKLRAVISARRASCSRLLRRAAGGYLDYLETSEHELMHKAKRRP